MLTTIWYNNSVLEERTDRFQQWYENYVEFEGEPTTITVHKTWDRWGGPEEGGWTYRCGEPIETVCIFSKTQAINELVRLHSKYNQEEYEDDEYDISLAQSYAKWYPEQRPHYE